jgi:hypothetical protein
MKRAPLWIAIVAIPVVMALGQLIAPQYMAHKFVEPTRPFHAFVCAGEIARGGGNPYRVEPLLSCEHRASVPPAPQEAPGVVEPAPLPGYALAFFSLFSGLPYTVAALVWSTILIVALAVATWALAQATSIPWYTIAAVLVPNAGLGNLAQAELPPICIAAISVSALLLARKHFNGAAIAVSLAMIEPHVGLAACLGLFIFAPKARWMLAACGALFAFVSFALLGADVNIEYLRAALPAQARSEFLALDQYSLTWVLHALGLSDRASLVAGSLSYLVMLVLGLWFAKRWSAELHSRELLVLVPAAAVLIGGVFIHNIQLAIALPAALVIADRSSERRGLAFAGVALIAIPWDSLQGFKLPELFSVIAILLLARESRDGASPPVRAAFAIAGVLAVVLLGMYRQPTFKARSPEAIAQDAPVLEPAAGAATNWQRFVEANAGPVTFGVVERKLLVWSGFLAVAIAAAGAKAARAPAAPRRAGARASEPGRLGGS